MKRILFVVVALVSCVTPLLAQEANSPKPDPQAYELLRRAQSVRETFPTDFAGFKAELVCNDNGQEAKGVLDYRPETGAKIIINGLSEEATGWVKQQLNSLLSHRRASDFAKGEGRHPLSLPPDDLSPLGRRVMVNDKLKSSYRVRDGQTTEVDRTMGDRIVVTILSTLPTGNGKFLPQHFVVNNFDVKTNQLLRTEMFTDEFAQIGNVWLPASRRVVFAEDGKLTARVITLRNPQLHQPQETATAR